MKINNNSISQMLIVFLLGAFSLVGCTKAIPFKELSPDEKEMVLSKSLIDTNEDYIYSASQQNSSMTAADAFPYSSGESKRVRVKLGENSLQVIELETDQRYASNDANNKLVLEIPIEHKEFNCAKDAYGECTNSEQNDSSIPWAQRKSIKLKFEAVKSAQLDLLPIMESQTMGDNCYQEISSTLKNAQIEKDAINFQIERVFKTNINCIGNLNMIKDATVSAIYHYSMVKAKTVLSKDYQTISYPENSTDQRTFGFFSTQHLKRDVDHNETEHSVVQIMNRWNPNRKVIDYHLSDEFAKPENEKIKELTYKTIGSINDGLKKSGAQFTINLHEPSGKVPGDIRNSMIVLVEDPVASSVIGYGPQTEDPVTGEIISARTVMFLGTIKSFIQNTYADILNMKREAKLLENQKGIKPVSTQSVSKLELAEDIKARVANKKLTGKVFGISSAIEKMKADLVAAPKPATGGSSSGVVANVSGAKIQKDLKNVASKFNDTYSGKDVKTKLKYLTEVKNCAFSPSGTTGVSEISSKLMDQFKEDAKPWAQLSDTDKQYVIDTILPEIWVPTLIHEIGHNLGLRHNFAASTDKDNFYTEQELADHDIDHSVPFSSIMDYGDDLRTLSVMGKYDIAALRFGYARQVEVKDQTGAVSLVDVPKTLESLSLPTGSELKSYGYCTDENVGASAGCSRFDLGVTYTEMAQNIIKTYEENYALRNFRNGRAYFSQMDDIRYAARIKNLFSNLRVMAETKESLKYRYRLADNDPAWTQYPFLADLKQATLLGGAFLAQVITVPDATCAIAKKDAPNKILGLQTLRSISEGTMSCFDLELANDYIAVAQAGKAFLSAKADSNRSGYLDQIDVRGIWGDKIAAIQTLFNRKTGDYTDDKFKDTYLNQPELRQALVNLSTAVMSDNVVDKLEFTLADGSKASLEVPYELSSSQVIPETMMGAMYLRYGAQSQWNMIADRFELRRAGATSLQRILARVVSREANDNDGGYKEDIGISSAFSVNYQPEGSSAPISRSKSKINIDGYIYVATDSNILAKEYINNITLVSTLKNLGDDNKVLAIYQAKTKNQAMPADATAAEKAVWALDAQVLVSYLTGVLKSTDYYKSVITDLSASAL